jgi:copper homeostasis protein
LTGQALFRPLLEAAVDSAETAQDAVAAGADRLELCGDLSVGGMTPTDATLDHAGTRFGVPVAVMIRPRGGDFVYTPAERRQMARDAARAAAHGAAALVTGGLTPALALDPDVFAAVADAAPGIPLVCHRAIDRTGDPLATLDVLARVGVARVLTSGGARTAWEGRDVLRAMVRQAPPGCTILPGGTVRADIAAELVAHTGVRELHADGRDATVIAGLAAVRYFSP